MTKPRGAGVDFQRDSGAALPAARGRALVFFLLTEELGLSGRRTLPCSEDALFELMV